MLSSRWAHILKFRSQDFQNSSLSIFDFPAMTGQPSGNVEIVPSTPLGSSVFRISAKRMV